MIDILNACDTVLTEAGFLTDRKIEQSQNILLFESSLVLGFIFAYPDPNMLLARWTEDSSRMIFSSQFSLRRAGEKAWNTYLICLAAADSDLPQSAAMAAIEEDLRGTRKIVRSDVKDTDDVRSALLPLLPLQSSPRLDAVDIPAEIRERTTELPTRAVEAFLSKADESLVVQILEEAT